MLKAEIIETSAVHFTVGYLVLSVFCFLGNETVRVTKYLQAAQHSDRFTSIFTPDERKKNRSTLSVLIRTL